jgi:phenylacetate-coenzyme A ligase PaaK-like adenylate-forming protein
LEAREKRALYAQKLSDLTLHHYNHSRPYQRICGMLGYVPGAAMQMEDVPYIPVRLFKEYSLLSVNQEQVVKTMTSSGTSGQAVSRIYLDKATAANQARVLVKIVSSFAGNKRLPLLIVDSPAVVKNRDLFSARGAGILGFTMLGRDATYMLDENFQIDEPRLGAFIEKHGSSRIFLYGFTFIIWEHLCQALRKKGKRLDLNGVLIHGGGWKKLASIAVDNDQFKRELSETTGIQDVFNYYGMVEQTGSVFMECSQGHLHSSIYSDLIIRDPYTFSVLPFGVPGLVQLVSLLPTSYPGHSILTEDIGEILGEDDCPCGRKGRYFRIHGRVQNAEVRGCSDVLASN